MKKSEILLTAIGELIALELDYVSEINYFKDKPDSLKINLKNGLSYILSLKKELPKRQSDNDDECKDL